MNQLLIVASSLLLWSFLFTSIHAQRRQTNAERYIFINSGGPSFTYDGVTWDADRNVVGGKVFANNDKPIDKTRLDTLYQTERWGNFEYTFTVKKGEYIVRLHFAEIYDKEITAPGQRVFDVYLQDSLIYDNLDVFAESGGGFTALVLETTVTARAGDDNMKIRFAKVVEEPKVSGLEIYPVGGSKLPLVAGPLEMPLVPVAGALLPDGKVLVWSAYWTDKFSGGSGATSTAILDPDSGKSKFAFVSETGHDMFCPGTAILGDGRIMVTGGNDSAKTTFYDPSTNKWTSGPQMNKGRGYHAMTILSDGSVLTLGGSWSGERGGKDAEVWKEGIGWQTRNGIVAQGSLNTDDVKGVYRGDNHMWLFQAPNGRIFHAGPAKRMHWIDLAGDGTITDSIPRGDDKDAMNGNAVLYDIGKILTVGGAEIYDEGEASKRAFVIDINGKEAKVERVGDMAFRRAFHNSVVLPTGDVVVTGGQAKVKPFSDDDAIMTPEIWSPKTKKFTQLSDSKIKEPRTYHSIALLMKDGRVMIGGGGLPEINHFSVEILTPPYLLNPNGSRATRPMIVTSPSSFKPGAKIKVTMNTYGRHSFALVRLGVATHAINLDQRRIPLSIVSANKGVFDLKVPTNPNVVPPGFYLLFAMNENGVPSVGEKIKHKEKKAKAKKARKSCIKPGETCRHKKQCCQNLRCEGGVCMRKGGRKKKENCIKPGETCKHKKQCCQNRRCEGGVCTRKGGIKKMES